MLLRGLFWIAVVALFMPHEPDLGLGRPGLTGLSTDAIAGASNAIARPVRTCADHQVFCATGWNFLASLQNTALRSLGQVKADIEAAERRRALGE